MHPNGDIYPKKIMLPLNDLIKQWKITQQDFITGDIALKCTVCRIIYWNGNVAKVKNLDIPNWEELNKVHHSPIKWLSKTRLSGEINKHIKLYTDIYRSGSIICCTYAHNKNG
jgi:hypothetical protein